MFAPPGKFRSKQQQQPQPTRPPAKPKLNQTRLQASSLHVITVREVMWSVVTFVLALAINLSDIIASSDDERLRRAYT